MTNDPFAAAKSGETSASSMPRKGSFRGNNSVVAADHPLAASTGEHILMEGGSAADAAIAMSAVLTVVQPQMSHLGGDLFAMTYSSQEGSLALNSSGAAPSKTKVHELTRKEGIPETGVNSITVPGCVAGWEALHIRFGKLPWSRLFEDAERLAREGFPPSENLLRALTGGTQKVEPNDYFFSIFGEVLKSSDAQIVQTELSKTFQIIMSEGANGFYTGEIASKCLKYLNSEGELFTADDWHGDPRWEKPLTTTFCGYDIQTQPPPSRGLVLLLALKKYASLLKEKTTSSVTEQLAIQAFIDASKTVNLLAGDPDWTNFDAYELLENNKATRGVLDSGSDGGTTYLLAVDSSGHAISLIQSIFSSWGSGILIPETGVIFNNRMGGFVLTDDHPNRVNPGKRPMHTLHSYLVTNNAGDLYALGGTPGAFRQPQTNLQILDSVLRLQKHPQAALDEPRWGIDPEKGLFVELRAPNLLGQRLHIGDTPPQYLEGWDSWTGRASFARLNKGLIEVGCDLRGEGQAIIN